MDTSSQIRNCRPPMFCFLFLWMVALLVSAQFSLRGLLIGIPAHEWSVCHPNYDSSYSWCRSLCKFILRLVYLEGFSDGTYKHRLLHSPMTQHQHSKLSWLFTCRCGKFFWLESFWFINWWLPESQLSNCLSIMSWARRWSPFSRSLLERRYGALGWFAFMLCFNTRKFVDSFESRRSPVDV